MTDRLIYVTLVAVWLAYLVPLGLRRAREVSGRGSMESFSSSMLALGRRSRAARGVDAAAPGGTSAGSPVAPRADSPPQVSPLDRPSARVAATRRRRTLLALLTLALLVAVLVVTLALPWRVVLGPVALVLAWLVACRVQVLRQEDAAWVAAATRQAGPVRAARPAVRVEVARDPVGDQPDEQDTVVLGDVDAARRAGLLAEPAAHGAHLAARLTADGSYPPADRAYPTPGAPGAHGASGAHPAEPVGDTMPARRATGAHAAPAQPPVGGAPWDPRPLTLPTYVSKPCASRPVRRADLTASRAWSSGRAEGGQVEATQPPHAAEPPRRAAGG